MAASVMSNDGTFRSTALSSGGRTSLSRTNLEIEEQDKKAAVAVKRLKTAILLFFSLTAIGVVAAFFIYRAYNSRALYNRFRDRFKEDAENMLASIGANIDSTLGATDAFAISMLSYAKATKQTYPFVTIDDFAVQAGKLRKNSRAKYITTYQVVKEDQRLEWEEYSANHNSWIDESIAVQSRDRSYFGPNITDEWMEENYIGNYDLIHAYDELVFGYGGNSTDGVDYEGPYLPIWQCTPVIPFDPIYNWDLLSSLVTTSALVVMETHLITISEPYLVNWPDDLEYQEENEAEAEWFSNYLEPGEEPLEPVFDIYFPIIVEALDNVHHHAEGYSASNHKTSGYNKTENQLGAFLALSIYWRDALRDLLPSGSAGVLAVFENTCDVPPFGYEITGPKPKYLGIGYQNASYTGDPELKIVTNLLDVWDFGIAKTSYTGIPINEEICPYTITVYPAESAMEMLINNNDNTVYVVLVLVLSVAVLTIAFTLLFFFLYDRLVRNEIKSKISLLDAKRNFVRFVSHEVRTPLNTVCMGLTLINQDFKSREKKMKKMSSDDSNDSNSGLVTKEDIVRWSSLTQEVSQNADVAVGVLNDLLNIDKIQMGAFKLEMEVLPIWEIVEQTTLEFNMMAAKQKIDLKIDMSSLAGSTDVESVITHSSMLPAKVLDQILVGDNQRLRQVLRNLLSNAIKFSKNRSVTVKISRREHPSNISTKNVGKAMKEFKMSDGTSKNLVTSGRIVVDVVDTGVGMTPVQLETVFDVGTQFNASKLQSGGGSGLGLAFAKAISEQHGGSLRAYSDGRDKGTTFRLDLPLHLDDADASTKKRSSSASLTDKKTDRDGTQTASGSSPIEDPSEENELEPMNILVVDDARMNRKLLTRLLESNGHTCGQAENGQDLIDVVKTNMVKYDCILVDYEMPVMNGPEACKNVREMGYTGFIVGVTGNLLPEDVGYFMDCGADAVLPKPFKYDDLEELLIEQGMFGLS